MPWRGNCDRTREQYYWIGRTPEIFCRLVRNFELVIDLTREQSIDQSLQAQNHLDCEIVIGRVLWLESISGKNQSCSGARSLCLYYFFLHNQLTCYFDFVVYPCDILPLNKLCEVERLFLERLQAIPSGVVSHQEFIPVAEGLVTQLNDLLLSHVVRLLRCVERIKCVGY